MNPHIFVFLGSPRRGVWRQRVDICHRKCEFFFFFLHTLVVLVISAMCSLTSSGQMESSHYCYSFSFRMKNDWFKTEFCIICCSLLVPHHCTLVVVSVHVVWDSTDNWQVIVIAWFIWPNLVYWFSIGYLSCKWTYSLHSRLVKQETSQ